MQVFCRKCQRKRQGIEAVCLECNLPYTIYPEFKYRDSFEGNFPYATNPVSLGETTTPIVAHHEVSFKLDYYQPTFSYKDRGARTLVTFLRNNREKVGDRVSEDSSGNAGASMAAYGRKAGFDVDIYVPGSSKGLKMELIKRLGANLTPVDGTREDVREAAVNGGSFYAGHSIYPEFKDGIRTLSYEVFEQTNGKIPDSIYIPTSAGTLLAGIYLGFRHLLESGEISSIPHLVACQPELMSPLESKLAGKEFVLSKERSIADALVTVEPPLLDELLEILRNNGSAMSVSEDEILRAHSDLANSGIFTEYSSAVAYACYKKKKIAGNSLIILTGNGLKNLGR